MPPGVDPAMAKQVIDYLKQNPQAAQHVFDDIKSNGAGAMEKYWNDSELMSKISEKMGSVNLRSNGSSTNGKSAKAPALSSQVHNFQDCSTLTDSAFGLVPAWQSSPNVLRTMSVKWH